MAYNRFRYYSTESGTYISQNPIGLDGGMPNMYAYVGDLNSWVDVFGLSGVGNPLFGGEKVFRIGNHVNMSNAEAGLNPPGISVIRANSAEEAGDLMKKAYPNATNLHKAIDGGNVMETTVDDIRKAGFDVLENRSNKLGDAHARLIHPEGVDGFDKNKNKLKKTFGCQ